MNYFEMLKNSAREGNSIVCMGADPVIEKIPVEKASIEEKIFSFYSEIIRVCKEENCLPGAVKPNYAFFAQYGFDGLKALKRFCELAKEENMILILDAKRGDIGKTSEAYARECFAFWKADATTVNPFMGSDSVRPFIKWAEENGNGCYVLNRTSNEGAKEFQNQRIGEKELFKLVSEKIIEWGKQAKGNLGSVVGATSTKELEEITKIFSKAENQVPLLIPGVGAQGGTAEEVTETLRRVGYDLSIVRINASSSINYAFEKEQSTDFAGAAAREIKGLNKEMRAIF